MHARSIARIAAAIFPSPAATLSAVFLIGACWAALGGAAGAFKGVEVIGAKVGANLMAYGGQDPANKAMGTFWKFDPATGQWAQLPSNPVPVHHGAAASIGNKFYVFGGFRLPDTGKVGWYPENKAWVFDMDKGSWSALPPMPTPHGALAAVAVGTRIYVSGGAKIPSGVDLPDGLTAGGPVELLGTLEALDTQTNT